MSDTSERSLEHWSEAGRAGMEAFYALARRDYRLLAEALDWPRLLRGRRSLLDVACGSGKFPEALLEHGGLPTEPMIDYALLDPSAFSIAEARRTLAPPFAPGAEYEVTLQNLPAEAGPYDVVWATHALYALGPAELPRGIERFLAAIAPGGVGVIAHAARDSHYLRFYQGWIADFRDGVGTPYASSEDVLAALVAAGAQDRTDSMRLHYFGEAPLDARETVEGYLQRCAFDDSVALEAMEAGARLGPYLARCRDADRGAWRFEQHVELIVIGAGISLGDLARGREPAGG